MATPETVAIPVPRNIAERLGRLAQATNDSTDSLTARVLAGYLEHEEWRVQSILQGIEDADAGRTVPHEDVERWLESWGTDRELPPPK